MDAGFEAGAMAASGTLISQPYYASIFLLFLLSANRLVRVEIPTDSNPQDAASVLADVDKGIHGIVGCDVPFLSVETISQKC